MKPILTIVVPVRNMAGNLKNLRHWLSLTDFSSIEVIIVEDLDDPLTSIEISELVNEVDSRNVKLISSRFGSPGAARNAGKAVAVGEWIAFWDADDFGYSAAAVSELKKLGRTNQLDLLIFSYQIMDWVTGNLISSKRVDESCPNMDCIAGSPGLWRFLIRTDLVRFVHFPNYRMAEDQIFVAKVNNLRPRIRYRDIFLYSYFKNVPGQLTGSKSMIKDLDLSTGEMAELCKLSKPSAFNYEVLIRQIISGIKHGSISLKIRLSLKLMRTVLISPSILKFTLILKVLQK